MRRSSPKTQFGELSPLRSCNFKDENQGRIRGEGQRGQDSLHSEISTKIEHFFRLDNWFMTQEPHFFLFWLKYPPKSFSSYGPDRNARYLFRKFSRRKKLSLYQHNLCVYYDSEKKNKSVTFKEIELSWKKNDFRSVYGFWRKK